MRSRWMGGALASWLPLLLAGCSATPTPAPAPAVTPLATPWERMPAGASIWITSDPAAPAWPVAVDLLSPDDPGIHRSHAFAEGVPLRGSVPLSAGRYRLSAMGGACALDLALGPDREADVVIRVTGAATCALTVAREHGDEVTHDGASELVGP